MILFDIRIPDRQNPPVVRFPDRCVNCGGAKSIVMPLKLHMGIEKRGQGVTMGLPVPLCKECERKERQIRNVTLGPFVLAGLVSFVAVFIPVWLLTPDGTTNQTIGFSVTVGVLAAIIAGLIGGSLVEVLLKIIFAPVYGRLLLKRPLTALSLFDDSEDVIGLSTRFAKGKSILRLIFENDEIGRKFITLNPPEKS